MHAIFFVAFDSKYYYTSSSCRLKSGAPQTFSADPTYVPKVKALQGKLDDLSMRLWHEALDMKISIGEIIIIAGTVGIILCLIPAIKQKKALAIIGILFALGAILLGLMQGTHMFS